MSLAVVVYLQFLLWLKIVEGSDINPQKTSHVRSSLTDSPANSAILRFVNSRLLVDLVHRKWQFIFKKRIIVNR